MSDVVKERRRPDYCLLLLADRSRVLGFAKERQSAPRKVVGSECVLEPRVRRARVDEVCPSQLTDISQALEHVCVDKVERQLIDTNVIPDGVAQYLEVHDRSCRVVSRWGRRS